MYGPNQSPVDAGKKSVSWKLSGADSGRITDHPQRKYSIENSERALKCSAGFPEVDGKGAGGSFADDAGLRPLGKVSALPTPPPSDSRGALDFGRSEEHTSELQSLRHLVCRLL